MGNDLHKIINGSPIEEELVQSYSSEMQTFNNLKFINRLLLD